MAITIGGRIKAVGHSDVGCVRTLNEDSYRLDERSGLLIVADGMGGHDAGEVASNHVIESMAATLSNGPFSVVEETDNEATVIEMPQDADGDGPTLDDPPSPLLTSVRSAVEKANAEVNALNRERGFDEGSGMGATVVGLWFSDYSTRPVVFHVGDSRVYRYHRNRLLQVTRDHSMYQQWIDFGGTGRPPAQNIILQAMGPSENVTPDVAFQEAEAGDIFLICTDGLSGMLTDDMMDRILRSATPDTLEDACTLLIEQAKERGGKDNVTVILAAVLS
ncbi:MAG: serine/threonine-protein phosphatase [Magnetococcales bacterium]|nr:serine/threonine-protein phosphatase [Magnetococcales bacterium]